jgi:uncharacterized membrane protein YjjP (DUF1212 family)
MDSTMPVVAAQLKKTVQTIKKVNKRSNDLQKIKQNYRQTKDVAI